MIISIITIGRSMRHAIFYLFSYLFYFCPQKGEGGESLVKEEEEDFGQGPGQVR